MEHNLPLSFEFRPYVQDFHGVGVGRRKSSFFFHSLLEISNNFHSRASRTIVAYSLNCIQNVIVAVLKLIHC